MDLFSDLDNTLIYSHRRALPCDKVVVERWDGKEQSYMTDRTLRFLQRASWIRLIPVTTRSKEQYLRIFVFGASIPCRYALVCNGGELLIDGETDGEWLEETKRLAQKELAALPIAEEALSAEAGAERIQRPSGLMLYAKCEAPAQTAAVLREKLSGLPLNILSDSRKVYCLPRTMQKGAALHRFRRRFQTGFAVAAGDSVFDISLLNAADAAVATAGLEGAVRCRRRVTVDSGEIFSDSLCSLLEQMCPDKLRR